MDSGIVSFKVADTIAAYRIVQAVTSTAYTVELVDTSTSQIIGVTYDAVATSGGGNVPVAIQGIHKVYFNDTVTSGQLVASDASGRGIPAAGITLTNTYVLGVLVGPTIAATGTIADVLVRPHTIYGQV